MWGTFCDRYAVKERMFVIQLMILYWYILGEPQEDAEHRDYVPTIMPACYGKKVLQRTRDQAESRYQRLLCRRAAGKATEEEKHRAEEEAKHLRLEAAITMMEFSQQEFVKDVETQTYPPSSNDQQVQTHSQSMNDQEQQTTPIGVS